MTLVRSSTRTPSSGRAILLLLMLSASILRERVAHCERAPRRACPKRYHSPTKNDEEKAMKSARLWANLIACSAFAAMTAFGQSYPAKPVRVVIPWPPGGSNDIVGRIIAQKLSEAMGPQFIVENTGGAPSACGTG